ncbi:MAG TPA: serine/threonine-protein kinase [Kofleriaceae bacterium]|jgi:hypothetical protein|nr:serine/threonine-protein kinase [Kofleriaceae bacterium]
MSVDTNAFELTRFGLRFASDKIEAAYRSWHRDIAVPLMRVGMYGALFNWMCGLAIAPLWRDRDYALTAFAWILLLPVPAIVAALLCTYRVRLHRLVLPLGALASLVSGIAAVGMFASLDAPMYSSPIECITVFFTCTIFRLRPIHAALAVLPGVALNLVYQLDVFYAGTTDMMALTMSSLAPIISLICGVYVCVVNDRNARVAYRDQRVVALQQELIDRLQKAELQHQVAARSRGLAEALARLHAASPSPVRLAIDDVVDDRYRIVRAIGSGGMGEVYEVERTTDALRLALKTLKGVGDRVALARFAREAQILAELEHPNVIAARDIGVTPDGVLFFVMELVRGSSLVEHRARFGERAWVIAILAQIADALVAMHERGIVHRDLKPSNILLDGTTVKVADFGLAGLVDVMPLTATATVDYAEPSRPLTRTGAIMGTPLYMAPELAAGVDNIAPSADVFSFGVIAFELLAGKLPHAVPPVLEQLAGRASPAPEPLASHVPALPSELCALVDRCLARTPSERPHASSIAAELRSR